MNSDQFGAGSGTKKSNKGDSQPANNGPTQVNVSAGPQPSPTPIPVTNPSPSPAPGSTTSPLPNPSLESSSSTNPGPNPDSNPSLNLDLAPKSTPNPTSTPNQAVVPTPTPPVGDEQNPSIPSEKPQKKKRTGLIVGIIIVIIVLLGGGAFMAYAIIKNQPDNIAAESVGNLFNADQVVVSGTYSYTPKNNQSDIGPITVTIDSKTTGINASSDVHVLVGLPSIDKTIELDLGEVTLKNGIGYFKIGGVTKLYEDILDGMIEQYLNDEITPIYSSQRRVCYSYSNYNEYQNCLDEVEAQKANSSVTTEKITSIISEIKSTIADIIKKIDNQWLEISIKDILDSDYLSRYIDQSTKDSIMESYNCSVEKTNNLSQYSNEFSALYSNNRFIKLNSEPDSFYRVLFDADSLTSFINALPETRVYSEYTSCIQSDEIPSEIPEVSVEDVRRALDDFPEIYAKFDGFLNHHLTELKIVSENESDEFLASLDLKFSYPSDVDITAPGDSRPIMDLVQDIEKDVTSLYQRITGRYTLW